MSETKQFNPGEWECIRCCVPGDEKTLVVFGQIGETTTRVCVKLFQCTLRQAYIHRMTVGEEEAKTTAKVRLEVEEYIGFFKKQDNSGRWRKFAQIGNAEIALEIADMMGKLGHDVDIVRFEKEAA